MIDQNVIPSLLETIARLRDPVQGCPWDLKQSHLTLKKYLIEETYEVAECLDESPIPFSKLKEELGDLLLQILLHSQLAEEKEKFNFLDVCKDLNEKLIRRHPHVFSNEKAATAEEVVILWDETKKKEKPGSLSILDGIPHALPALDRTGKILDKVTAVGFQWNSLKEPIDKIKEELSELEEEVMKSESDRVKIEAELGDLLFTICNISYLLKMDPDLALKKMLKRFEKRFQYIETSLKSKNKELKESSLSEMDFYWNEAKKNEREK